MNREDVKSAKTKKIDIEDVGRIIVDSAIKVHRALGPGLLESAYQACLAYELRSAGLKVKCEVHFQFSTERSALMLDTELTCS